MEIPKEIIEKAALTPDQVTAVSGYASTYIADQKKEWDGKANTDAQNILNGAASKVAELTGVEKVEGEKIADYINKAASTYLTTHQQSLEQAKKEYEEKAKNVKGAEAITQEYNALKEKYDPLLQIASEYEKMKDIPSKYEALLQENQATKLENAFTSIKPELKEGIDPYSLNGRWNEQRNKVLQEWDIEMIDGVPMAKSKANDYTTKPLKELMYNEEITKFIQGRVVKGTGGIVNPTQIDGVPFEVPELALKDSTARTNAIKEYLASKNIPLLSDQYKNEFSKYNTILLNKKTA